MKIESTKNNEPHDPGGGWWCAGALLGIWCLLKWLVIVFGALWLIGRAWESIRGNPLVGWLC